MGLQRGVLEDALGVDGGEARERRNQQRRHHTDCGLGVVVEVAPLSIAHLRQYDSDHEQHKRDELDAAEALSEDEPREEGRRKQLRLHDHREDRRLEPRESYELEHLLRIIDASGHHDAEEDAPLGAQKVDDARGRTARI